MSRSTVVFARAYSPTGVFDWPLGMNPPFDWALRCYYQLVTGMPGEPMSVEFAHVALTFHSRGRLIFHDLPLAAIPPETLTEIERAIIERVKQHGR